MSATVIIVVRFSASSHELWAQLAEGLEFEIHSVVPGDLPSIPGAAAVVLTAAGAEREAVAWLEGRDITAGVPVFMIGADTGRRLATEGIRAGVRDYFALPEDSELLHNALAAAIARYHETSARRVAAHLDHASAAFHAMAGADAHFVAVLERAALLAPFRSAVALILGEDGSGKEVLARAIHNASSRSGAPFVPVNCSALPPHRVAADLFGHEAHHPDGTRESAPGLFEVANGGTLYLDEVAALPVDVQARLLRVLETNEVTRGGGTRSRKIDVRVLAGSSEDLERAIHRGTLRQDLHLRLNAVTLTMPPLRERGEDVLLIAQHLLASLAGLHGVPVPEISLEARRALLEFRWPGNVRELKNALERALLLSLRGQLNMGELFPAPARRFSPPGGLPFPAELDEITNAAATAMLDVCNGNVSEAARRLGISRSRLRRLRGAVPVMSPSDTTPSYQERGVAS